MIAISSLFLVSLALTVASKTVRTPVLNFTSEQGGVSVTTSKIQIFFADEDGEPSFTWSSLSGDPEYNLRLIEFFESQLKDGKQFVPGEDVAENDTTVPLTGNTWNFTSPEKIGNTVTFNMTTTITLPQQFEIGITPKVSSTTGNSFSWSFNLTGYKKISTKDSVSLITKYEYTTSANESTSTKAPSMGQVGKSLLTVPPKIEGFQAVGVTREQIDDGFNLFISYTALQDTSTFNHTFKVELKAAGIRQAVGIPLFLFVIGLVVLL